MQYNLRLQLKGCARATVYLELTGTRNRTYKISLTGITTVCQPHYPHTSWLNTRLHACSLVAILKLHPRNACFIICCISRGETTPHNSHPPSHRKYALTDTHTLAPLTPYGQNSTQTGFERIFLFAFLRYADRCRLLGGGLGVRD